MNILVVEDDATSRSYLMQLVEKLGHKGVATGNGEEAWQLLGDTDIPELVILDRMLPGMDGVELCKKIRARKAVIHPYIIMVTIKGEKSDIVSGLEAGADDYLSKPFDPEELRARIEVGKRMLHLQNDLAARIEEKDTLIREIHHRMKNNMNTIGSLLELQASSIGDTAAAEALLDAKSRLLSMGILYDKLYRSENIRELSVTEFFPTLINEVVEHFPHGSNVHVECKLEDFTLGAKMLSLLGIVVNELVTNTMKYAFPKGRRGRIRAEASINGPMVRFILEDDGIGLDEAIDCHHTGGFGLKLVGILVRQLGGSVHIERDRGTRFILEFARK